MTQTGQAPRRSGPVQRQKSSTTRERVVRAAIDLIAEEGLDRATVTRLAEESGVSWGGIQHQFGGKAAILNSVLECVLVDFRENVERFSTRATTIEGRVRALVNASWDLMRDPTYQAFREVMRNASRASTGIEPASVVTQVSDALAPLREQLFPELCDAPKTLELMNVVLFATLSGMAEQERYRTLRASLMSAQLKILSETLVEIARERRSY